jgi:hypothetical protein
LYVNDAIEAGEPCSLYYPSRLALFYVVSRAFENGISCFERSREKIVSDTLGLQKASGSFGSDLETALALNTLLNFGYVGGEVDSGIGYLLKEQSGDGSWGMDCFYTDFGPTYYGSRELTTALVVEAMRKYQRLV